MRDHSSDGLHAAFIVACDTCKLFPPDTKGTLHRFGAETVARAILAEMHRRGIDVLWPTWLHYQPDQIAGSEGAK